MGTSAASRNFLRPSLSARQSTSCLPGQKACLLRHNHFFRKTLIFCLNNICYWNWSFCLLLVRALSNFRMTNSSDELILIYFKYSLLLSVFLFYFLIHRHVHFCFSAFFSVWRTVPAGKQRNAVKQKLV